MPGIIGKKLGMTSMFAEDGKNIPCTVIQAGPCTVTQVKTKEIDGYEAVQLGFDDKREKNTPNALVGHFKKAGTTPKRKVVEFSNLAGSKLGETLTVEQFQAGEWIDIVGTSIGKGFQGVVKRHNFAGVGQATHGQHNRLRAPGSVGACSFPARVFKGIRMAGRMGGDRVTVQNLQVIKVISEENLLVVKGSIPGHKGAYVIVNK